MDYAVALRQSEPGFEWEAVVASPLSRALETAEIIAGALGLEVSGTYAGMQERSFGEAEGVQVTVDNWQNMEETFAGIEPLEELRARAIESLNVALQEHRGKNLIVVAHGMWISQTLTELTGKEISIPVNASVTELPLELLRRDEAETHG